jgi:hypothetical protein
MGAILVLVCKVGKHRLAQAYAAIVAGYLAVKQYVEASLFQEGHSQGQQQPVLEAASTQGHGLQAGLPGDLLTDGQDYIGQGQVKAPANLGLAAACRPISLDRL